MPSDSLDLAGSMLIAMPGMSDPRFANALIYLCDYSSKGAMGLIVNKPAHDMTFAELLEQLEIEPTVPMDDIDVFFGGPVETGRGFVLHSSEYVSDLRTLKVRNGMALTPTLDVLEAIASGEGPREAMMMLGYAGWGPGQLEGEIARNGWLTCDGSKDLVFRTGATKKWTRALKGLGIDPAMLSAEAGSA
ncbi:MAG: YqgE/AlgH family protein [Aliishimia sp.]